MTHSEITALTGLRIDHGVSPKKGVTVWWIRDGMFDEFCEASAQDGDLSERCLAAAHRIAARDAAHPGLETATRSGALYQRFFDSEDAACAAIESLL